MGGNILITCQERATAKESHSLCPRASSKGFWGAGPRSHHGSLVVIAGMETREPWDRLGDWGGSCPSLTPCPVLGRGQRGSAPLPTSREF